LGPNISFGSIEQLEEIKTLTNISNMFVSWFWRFYDNLFRLIFYNFIWFVNIYSVGWLSLQVGHFRNIWELNLIWLYVVYLIECAISVGWAFIVFRVIIEGKSTFSDYLICFRKYFIKAMGVSALSGTIVVITFYNLCFYLHFQSFHCFFDILIVSSIILIFLLWAASTLFQWPILFFQDPPFWRIFYKSFLLVLSNGPVLLGMIVFLSLSLIVFLIMPFFWYFISMVFFFSLQCVVLEKLLLKYKITFENKPIEPILGVLRHESQRSWRELLRPWENR